MKKLFVMILAVAMLCTASVAVSATTISSITSGNSTSQSVTGKYVAGSATVPVYSVDISWGSMEFTYTDASLGTWDPTSHTYNGSREAVWSCVGDANKITVTNHSNAGVKATFSYAAATGFDAVSGSFDKEEITLDSAIGTAVAAAPSDTATLTLAGALSKDTADNTQIGSVTVTLGSGD